MFKFLALLDLVFGTLLFGGSLFTGIKNLQSAEPAPAGVLALTALMAIMGLGFVLSSLAFLKNPDQRKALAVARNTAVLAWLSTAVSLHLLLAGSGGSAVPFTVAVIAAGIAYFWVFKPAALRQFPAASDNP